MEQRCRYCAYCENVEMSLYFCLDKKQVLTERKILAINRCASYEPAQVDIITGDEVDYSEDSDEQITLEEME